MAKEEDLMIPAVTEVSDSEWMPAGVHLVKVMDVKLGKPTKEGFPGHEYTFGNKDKKVIDKVFYFNNEPNNPAKKCKAEWVYAKLKAAIGIEAGKSIPKAQIVGKKLYIVVAKVELIDKDKKPIMNKNGNPTVFSEMLAEFYPYVEGQSKPAIEGDPEKNGGVPSGKFHEMRLGKDKVAAVTQTDAGFEDSSVVPETSVNANDDF